MPDDFFAGVEQVDMKFNGGKGKMPIFYRDARSFTLMLPANWFMLKRMLPDPRFFPAQVLPGVGVITLSAFEYFDTDITDYNELSVGIVLNNPYYAPIPGYNILRQYLARFYYVYVYHLPVTTDIALRAGVDFYNYPKFIADIEFSDVPGRISCDLSREGEKILTISGTKEATFPVGEMKFMCQLYHNRQPEQAEFKVNVVDGVIRWAPTDVAWEFNRGNPIGRELAEVVLGNRALCYLYMPKIQGILYGPEQSSILLMRRAIIAAGLLPSRKPAAKKKAAVKKKPAAKKKTSKKA